MSSHESLPPTDVRTSNKRQFLATMLSTTLAVGGGGRALGETDHGKEGPLRSHKYSPKVKHPSLKEYFVELITKDSEIRKLHESVRKSMVGGNQEHLQEFDVRDVSLVQWFPSRTTWGRQNATDMETFLAVLPLKCSRSHYEWVEDAVIAQLQVLTHHSGQQDPKEEEIPQGVTFQFFGFQKITMQPFLT